MGGGLLSKSSLTSKNNLFHSKLYAYEYVTMGFTTKTTYQVVKAVNKIAKINFHGNFPYP